MAIAKILSNGKLQLVTEYYKHFDVSEYYQDEINNLKVESLDKDQMQTFLYESLDNEINFVWELVSNQLMTHGTHNDYQLIDFNNCCLENSHEFEIKLSEDLFVIVDVTIFFNVRYDCNNESESDCRHDYEALCVGINNFNVINKTSCKFA